MAPNETLLGKMGVFEKRFVSFYGSLFHTNNQIRKSMKQIHESLSPTVGLGVAMNRRMCYDPGVIPTKRCPGNAVVN